MEIEFKEEVFKINGAIFEVYRNMGCGFLESVYQECLSKEFQLKGIPFVEQQALTLSYKGYQLKQVYKPDFICFQNIIVEIKALKDTGDEHRAQLLNYFKATNAKVGLLVNFGHYPKATIERFVN